MSRFLEMPDPLFEKLLQAARASGTTPVEWIAAHLAEATDGKHKRNAPTPEEITGANARLKRHMVSLGYPTGIDNEQIDADLGRAYSDPHSDADPSP
jgi:hypothetical protein